MTLCTSDPAAKTAGCITYQFYRQKPIGNFIVDFYYSKANLVLELDGRQHYTDEGRAEDNRKDVFIRSKGLQVLRFADRDLFENLNGIIGQIGENL